MNEDTDTKSLTLKMPLVMYSQLLELARIANRTPQSLALYFVSTDVEQAYEEDMPCSLDVLSTLLYSTMREAAHVADAANAWQARYRKQAFRYEPVLTSTGNYQVRGSYRKESDAAI